jgi:hypothetical protein
LNEKKHKIVKKPEIFRGFEFDKFKKVLFNSWILPVYEKRNFLICFGWDGKEKFFVGKEDKDGKLQKLAVGYHSSVKLNSDIDLVLDSLEMSTLKKIGYTSLIISGRLCRIILYLIDFDKNHELFNSVFFSHILWFVLTSALRFPTIPYLSLIFSNTPFVYFLQKCLSFMTFPSVAIFLCFITNVYFPAYDTYKHWKLCPLYLNYAIAPNTVRQNLHSKKYLFGCALGVTITYSLPVFLIFFLNYVYNFTDLF